jgi:hypothetical protein
VTVEFGLGKKKVTSQEMGEGLWMFCRKFSNGAYQQIVPVLEQAGHAVPQDKQLDFSRELIMVNLWIISKALPADRAALDHLHQPSKEREVSMLRARKGLWILVERQFSSH